MRDPRDELRVRIQRGKTLSEQARILTTDARLLSPRIAAGQLVLRLFDVNGRRSIVALGRYLGSQGLANRAQTLFNAIGDWHSETLSLLRTISVVRNDLTLRGNTATLTRRFARAKKYKRLDTRIEHAVAELEAITEEELVYNDEIPELKARRRREAIEERQQVKEQRLLDLSNVAPGLELIKLTNREQLRSQFASHHEVARMVEGALDAYSSTGADANRQALASCRSALELLVRETTGQTDWRTGLGQLAEGARKKLVSQTYAFLSGYGSHPGGTPTRKDAAYGIRLTIASCFWLMEPIQGNSEARTG